MPTRSISLNKDGRRITFREFITSTPDKGQCPEVLCKYHEVRRNVMLQ